MKTFKKVLASALAAAMVVTAFPVTNAEAATAPKLSATKATLYVGQSKTITVKNLTSKWKGAKVVSATSKKSVAKVSRKGNKITVKAVKAGKATVTVKVTPKKGKAKSLKATITVKNPALSLKAANEVAVGATEQITATVKPSNTKVTFTSSDEAIAKVDEKGVVTGVKAGDVTITAKAGKTTKTVKMTVKTLIISDVAQTKSNQIVLTYKGDASKIGKDDVAIVRTTDNQKIYTKAVTDNKKDGKLVVDTVLNMTDAKEYTVTCKDTTLKFTATDGVIANIAVDPTEIVYNTATEIDLIALDANKVELARYAYGSAALATNGYDFNISVTSDKGYFVGSSKLVLNKVGDTATFTATKHTGKYENGVEAGNLKVEGTIAAIDKAAVETSVEWTLSTNCPYDWSKVKANHDLILGENENLFIRIQDANGKEVFKGNPTTYNGYRLVSTNEDVVYVGGTSGNQLIPRKEGSAYVNVVDSKNNVVYAFVVTIKPAAKATSFVINKGSVNVSNSTNVTDSATIELTGKDQYGRDMALAGNYTLVFTNTVAESNPASAANAAMAANVFDGTTDVFTTGAKTTLTFNGTDSTTKNTKGAYSWKVEMKNTVGATVYTAVVNANVQEPDMSATPTYALLLNGENVSKTVDTTVTLDSRADQDVTVKVGKFYNGILGDYQAITEDNVTMKTPLNGNVAATNSGAGTRTSVASNAFTFHVRTGAATKYYKKAPTGTYKISVTVPGASGAGLQTINQNLVVTDSQSVLNIAKRDSVNIVSATDIQNAVNQAFEFTYNNVKLSTTAANAYEGQILVTDITVNKNTNKSKTVNGVNNDYLDSITVKVPVVLGDLNGDGTIDDTNDVIYIDQTASAGYFLVWR